MSAPPANVSGDACDAALWSAEVQRLRGELNSSRRVVATLEARLARDVVRPSRGVTNAALAASTAASTTAAQSRRLAGLRGSDDAAQVASLSALLRESQRREGDASAEVLALRDALDTLTEKHRSLAAAHADAVQVAETHNSVVNDLRRRLEASMGQCARFLARARESDRLVAELQQSLLQLERRVHGKSGGNVAQTVGSNPIAPVSRSTLRSQPHPVRFAGSQRAGASNGGVPLLSVSHRVGYSRGSPPRYSNMTALAPAARSKSADACKLSPQRLRPESPPPRFPAGAKESQRGDTSSSAALSLGRRREMLRAASELVPSLEVRNALLHEVLMLGARNDSS